MYKFSHLSKYSWDGRQEKSANDLSQKEIDLIDQLRRKPLIMERIQEILGVANASAGGLKTADQMEEC